MILVFFSNDDIANVKYFKYDDNTKVKNYTKEEKKDLKVYTLSHIIKNITEYVDGATQIYLDFSPYLENPNKLIRDNNNDSIDTLKYMRKKIDSATEQREQTMTDLNTFIKNITARRTYIVSKKGLELLKTALINSKDGIKNAVNECNKTFETFKKDTEKIINTVDKIIINDNTERLKNIDILPKFTKMMQETSSLCAKLATK